MQLNDADIGYELRRHAPCLERFGPLCQGWLH